MSVYHDRIYPQLVRMLGNPKPIRDIRQRIVALAHGTVLEIGVGPGVNFVYYDPARVRKVYALEPNLEMLQLAERQRRRAALDVAFLDLPGEHIPLADGVVDTVVSTFTLCTIPGIVEAIRGMARVLKPDGMLIFFELGLAPDPQVRRWQVRLEPLYHRLFHGLYLTRDIPALLTQGGFQIAQLDAAYIAAFPKSSTYCCWGTAIPHAR
ncbi:MAG: class I SAM-dependent methyltransferase, partial [Roseiflexaceae bacterium]